MGSFRTFYIFFLLILFSIAVAQAAGQRDLIIQKTMDCVDNHLQQSVGITWNDVCGAPGAYYQQHMEIVNQQMDQVQGETPPLNMPQDDYRDFQISQKESEWVYKITPEVSYIRYHEPGFMKESGVMSGINGSYTYRPIAGDVLNSEITDMYRLEGRFSYGKVDYNGGVQSSDGSSTPESFNGINDYMMEIRMLVGKDFIFNNQSTLLTPYLGGGYRFLFDSLYENKPYGYNRLIQYFYLPTGAEITTKLGDGWSIGADMEYDIFLGGLVESYLGGIGLGDLQNVQKTGYGLRGSIKLVKKRKRYNLILEPFVRYWTIHASNVGASKPFSYNGQEYVVFGEEPDNNSLEIGGKLGIEF
jgi:hypothetical protein